MKVSYKESSKIKDKVNYKVASLLRIKKEENHCIFLRIRFKMCKNIEICKYLLQQYFANKYNYVQKYNCFQKTTLYTKYNIKNSISNRNWTVNQYILKIQKSLFNLIPLDPWSL